MKFWKFVRNKATEDTPSSVELRIEGDIVDDDDIWLYEWFGESATSPNAFKNELSEFEGQDLTVWIDSYGGSVFAGASIYNALKERKGKTVAKIDKAMSAASVIAMAADEILMSPTAIIMIHNPMTGVYGDMHAMREVADVLDEIKESIINAYVGKTGRSRDDISAMMDSEKFMSAKAAVDEGFADGMLYQDEPIEMKDVQNYSFDRSEIMNGTRDSIKRIVAKYNVINANNKTEKDRLLLELELI